VVSLALTARPLIMPLLGALAVGTFQLLWPIQLAAGGVFVTTAWWIVILPESRSIKAMLEAAEKQFDWARLLRHGLWLLMLVVVALPAALAAHTAVAYFKAIGGFAAFLLVSALLMWLIAIVLRLVGQSSSYLRIARGLILGVALVRLAMSVGLLPGDDALADSVPWFLTGILWATVAVMAVDIVFHAANVLLGGRVHGHFTGSLLAVSRKRFSGRRSASLRFVREFGLTAALGGTFVLLGSAVYGLTVTSHPGAGFTRPGSPAGNAPVPPLPATDRALADAYSPVLALTADERWPPIRVDSYLAHAALNGVLVRAQPKLPTSCPDGRGAPCYRLTIKCSSGRDVCGHSEVQPPATMRPHSDIVHIPLDGATYVRVVRRDRPPSDGSPDPWVGWTRPDSRLSGLTTLIQYWFFYYYDEWEAPAFAGLLTQRHESDWEAVTVGLSASRPLFVAYSEHCSGTWVWWPQVEISDSSSVAGRTHPLVGVGRGSHANYPEANQPRSPDWTHCAGLPAGMSTPLSYASNIRDRTEYTWLWHQPARGLILVNARRPPMSYPGSWGGHDETVLQNFKVNNIALNGPGPLTPPLQWLWKEPLLKIFCNYSHPARFAVRSCPPGWS